MAITVVGNIGAVGVESNFYKDLGYKYPDDLMLKPGTELHDKIVEKVMSRAHESFDVMKKT